MKHSKDKTLNLKQSCRSSKIAASRCDENVSGLLFCTLEQVDLKSDELERHMQKLSAFLE